MKKTLIAVLLCSSLILNAQDRPAGYVDFGQLPASESGGEHVEIALGSAVMGMAASVLKKPEPEAAELLKGLRSVRVHVIEMKDDNRKAMLERIQAIRTDLDAKKWERIVSVKKKKEDVGIYLKTGAENVIEGLVLTVVDGDKEAVLINVVGSIKPEQVATLGEKLNIPSLKKFAAK
jgi:hypothetical protein